MRRFAIVLGVLVLLLVLLVAAAWVALQRIDWNAYKQPVAERVERATGRRLDLAGDVDLEIGLRPGVSIHDVAFANADWGSRPEMATLDELLVRVEILPLFSGQVVVDRIELVGLDVLLESRADGRANWQFEPEPRSGPGGTREPGSAPGEKKEEPAPGGPPASGPAEGPGAAAYALLVHEAEIRDARIVLRDDATGAERRITIAELLASTPAGSGPLSLEADASVGDAPLHLQGTIGGVQDVASGGPLDLDLRLETGGGQLQVRGAVAEPMAGKGLDLALKLAAPKLAPLGAVAGAELPDLGPLDLETKLTGGGDAYAIRGLSLSVGGTKLSGDVDVALGGERPRIDARLSSPGIDVGDFRAPGATARVRPAPGILLASTGSGERERLFSTEPLPLDGLGAADARLRLDAKQVVADTLRLEGVDLAVDLERSRLEVQRFKARLAGGTLDLGLTLDARRAPPGVKLNGRARGVRVGDLLASRGNDVFQDGPVDVDVDLGGRGRSLHEIAASLAGRLQLSMGEAVVRNQYAAVALSDLKTLSRGQPVTGGTVTCAFADFAVADGVARPDGLVLDLTSIALFGSGKIDLGREHMHLDFDRQAQQLAVSDVLPPFVVKGPLTDPKPEISAAGVAGKALDLGAALLGEGGERPKAAASGCRELLAVYRKQQSERGSSAEVTRKTILDLQDKEKRKEAVKRLKGLFD